MVDIVLFHHAQGLTPGVQAFADRLRRAGHLVIVPDYYGGLTFPTVEAGVAHAESVGFTVLVDRAISSVEPLPDPVVVAGFSLGALPAQRLAQTRSEVAGALLYHGGVPASVFETDWPAHLPLQVHVTEDDAWTDLNEAQELVDGAANGQLLIYPGFAHLVTDSSLPEYDPEIAEEIIEQSLEFLARLERTGS